MHGLRSSHLKVRSDDWATEQYLGSAVRPGEGYSDHLDSRLEQCWFGVDGEAMNREEYDQYWLDLWSKEGHRTQTFSLVMTGPAAAIVNSKKKRAGRPGSRGNYVSAAVEFYEKNNPSNRFSELRRLRTQVKRLQTMYHNLLNTEK